MLLYNQWQTLPDVPLLLLQLPPPHVQKCAGTEPAFVRILLYYSVSRTLEECITVYGNKNVCL